ncbi:MAG TPA: glycosyltransferase family 4 protein, partial [Vicinamibacteria bacterium]|nr:glycosyltransferase family 4 protein [Vicinamibacteria bacterium]
MTTIRPRGDSPKVLFLSGLQIYPTMSGGTLRSSALANALRHHGFDVRVHSLTGRKADYLARRPSSMQMWPGGMGEQVDRGVASAAAWLAGYVLGLPPVWISAHLAAGAASPGEALLSAALREKLSWCDAVVADFPYLYPIFLAPSARGKLRILSTHNIEHHLWRKPPIRAVVRDLEIRAARACDILVSCCAEDARFFEANAPVRQAVVVPNGIDLGRFCGIEAHRAGARRELGIPDDVMLFLFTASKWGPNREAFEYLLEFAKSHARLLAEERIHILLVGGVTAEPVHLDGFTATGRIDRVEPYFAAADAALNPMSSGAGTNVKMCEFIAMRLPIVSTPFGARGLAFEDGRSGFLFEKDGLAPVLSRVRRLFDQNPPRLKEMADDAYGQNRNAIDMNACAQVLVEAMGEAWERLRTMKGAPPSLESP